MIESVTTEPTIIKENENFKIKVKVTEYNTETAEGKSITLNNTKENGKIKFQFDGQTSQEVIEAVAGTEVSGTDLTISDYDSSKESKFTKFSGDTFQQTYTGKNLYSSQLELNGISGQTGENIINNARLRSSDYIAISDTTKTLSLQENLETYVYCYGSSKNFLGYIGSSWNTVPYTFTPIINTAFVRFIFRKLDDTVFTSTEKEYYQNNLKPQLEERKLSNIIRAIHKRTSSKSRLSTSH